MLEIEISHDQPSASASLYLDSGEGIDEAAAIRLPLKDGRVSKRLFYVPQGLKALYIEPVDSSGRFSIKHLRIVWLAPWFAHDRLAQRLSNLHYKWRKTPKSRILAGLKTEAREQGIPWGELAQRHYNFTFHRQTAGDNYLQWLKTLDEPSAAEVKGALKRQGYQPPISIILPVHNTNPDHLRECLGSVLKQSYPKWQLCIADDASEDACIQALLNDYAEQDDRIEVVYRDTNGHICAASNSALRLARGEFIALLDHDDCLADNALFHIVEALQDNPDACLLYSDEDKLNEVGDRFDPHFKPNWNPDLLLAQNYISHLGVYRTDLVRQLGGFREGCEGAQDHDLALRVTSEIRADQIVHIPRLLYHWRAGEGSTALESAEKTYTSTAGVAAVQDSLDQNATGALVKPGEYPNTCRVVWPLPESLPMVTMLIPTRDRLEILQPCVDAILEKTDYPNFEVIILDNQSTCPETLAYMERVSARDGRVRVLRWDYPFNYSAINNFGASHARGDILALVNNDIEPINRDWLTEMVRQVCRTDIGCVGAKLYYPNDTIQHGGVILGLGGVAGHSHKYFRRNAPGYFYRLHLAHNLSAVTAACLLVRKAVFEEVRGLNEEHLTVAFNDVDLCIKIREAGYRNLWTPYAELYHHESISRGADDNSKKRARATAEVEYMRRTWGELLDNDPAYSPNLTLVYEDFSLR